MKRLIKRNVWFYDDVKATAMHYRIISRFGLGASRKINLENGHVLELWYYVN